MFVSFYVRVLNRALWDKRNQLRLVTTGGFCSRQLLDVKPQTEYT